MVPLISRKHAGYADQLSAPITENAAAAAKCKEPPCEDRDCFAAGKTHDRWARRIYKAMMGLGIKLSLRAAESRAQIERLFCGRLVGMVPSAP